MHGAAGLEAWAGTPGTVGGADVRQRALRRTADRRSDRRGTRSPPATATTSDCPAAAMAFGYDRSRLQDTGEVLLSATFRVVARRSGGAARGRRASRWRFASARSRSTRRAPAASFRTRSRTATSCPDGHPVVGRRARRSGRAEGRVRSAARASRRRTATSSSTTGTRRRRDIRRLIERCRRDGSRALRRGAQGRDRLPRGVRCRHC